MLTAPTTRSRGPLVLAFLISALACGGSQTTIHTADGVSAVDPLVLLPMDAFAVAQVDVARLRASPHAERVVRWWTSLFEVVDPADDGRLVMGVMEHVIAKTDLVTFALSPNEREPDPVIVLQGRYGAEDVERWIVRLAGGEDRVRVTTRGGLRVVSDGTMTGVEMDSATWMFGPDAVVSELSARGPSQPGALPFESATLRHAFERLAHTDRAVAMAAALDVPFAAPVRDMVAREMAVPEGSDLTSFGMHIDVLEGLAFGMHVSVSEPPMAAGVADAIRERIDTYSGQALLVLLGLDELMSSGVVRAEGAEIESHHAISAEEADMLAYHLDHLARGLTMLGGDVVRSALIAFMMAADQADEPDAGEIPEAEPEPEVAGPDPIERYRVPVSAAEPAKGPAVAEVTIVEFADFECPFSARVRATLDQIVQTYPDRVRVVYRHNPLAFHTHARAASRLAIEAFAQGGEGRFWAAHDLLFDNQRALEEADLLRYAKELKLNVAKVKRALRREGHEARIKEDEDLAARLNARGTPSFFINGRLLAGAQPFERFARVIDEEIEIAEGLIGEGVPKAGVYARLMENARESAPSRTPTGVGKRPDPSAIYRVPIGDAPQKGPRNALVTIVELSDFQCPFCQRVQPTLKEIMDRYGNDVRIVWLNNPLPFHREAMPAALAALEAYEQGGAAKFWRMHDLIFDNQSDMGRQALEGHAAALGLDMRAFAEALDGPRHRGTVEAQQALARELGATGTPSFFINGRLVRGAQPLQAFVEVIDQELARAKKLLKSGVPRRRLYEKAIEGGATEMQHVED